MGMSTWKPLAGLLLGVSAALAASEIALARIAPLRPPMREVADGVADLEASNPDVLVLGSSHARSFEAVAALVAQRSGGTRRMVVVPEEGGTFTAFRWVLEHRLRRLIEERDAAGRLLRDRLGECVLVTTYWDSIHAPWALTTNLPSRAWTFGDYLADVAGHGLTDSNRNYVQSRWKSLLSFSALARDRGADHLKHGLLQWARLEPRQTADERRLTRLPARRGEFETDSARAGDQQQRAELLQMLDYFQERRIRVTIVLFPLVQEALTDTAKETTLQRYADSLATLARERPFRIVDLTLRAPLALADFEPDLDHVSADGNGKFAAWALANDLAFLLQPRRPDAAEARTPSEAGS
jgi:hypothetical protein